jgi:alcohol dehydrogenase (cytochrome c)
LRRVSSTPPLEDKVTTEFNASMSRTALHALLGLGTALGGMTLGLSGAPGAEVTFERLANPEPGNWLMNHRDYRSHRFSPLDAINKTNVKNLKLAFAVPLGGSSGNEYVEATPVVEDGFLYVTDVWSVVYKIDVRSGTAGHVVWKMDPGLQKPDRNRGVALWGNYVISVTGLDGRVIATDKETGRIVWDKNLLDQPDLEITAAPLALKDSIIIGASGGDNGVRDWIASLDPRTGNTQWKTFVIPTPGEPGSETWKDKNNAWRTGGGAMYVTGAYDPATDLSYWGTGNPVPRYDSGSRPGDNLYTDSTVAFRVRDGNIQWYFQHTANDIHDYDTSGSQLIIDGKVNGDDRKLVVHADRNGFAYTFDRLNGQFLKAVQYAEKVTWTRGLDPKTGKPLDYDPGRDVQTYNHDWKSVTDTIRNSCPDVHGGTNFWPPSYSDKAKLLYIGASEGCADITPDPTARERGRFGGGGYSNPERIIGSLTVVDPLTAEVKLRKELPYPDLSGVLTHRRRHCGDGDARRNRSGIRRPNA